MSAPKFVSY